MSGSTRPPAAALPSRLAVWVVGWAAAWLAGLATVPAAPADVVVLNGGGELRGEFVGRPDEGGSVAIRTRSGSTVRVPRDQVRRWAYRDPGREAFERRFDRTPPTAEAWWDLAEWALRNRLRPERERALRRLITLAPDHEAARLALGHKRDRGDWLTPTQWRRRNGLVLYGRRAVSPEEKALLERADARDASQQRWFRQARVWKRALEEPKRAGAARAEMVRLTDPDAIPALREFFADHPDPRVRTLYVQILSRLPGATPVAALATQAMGDVDDAVREQAVRALAEETAPRAGAARAGAAQQVLLGGLRSDGNLTVRRAAAALGELGDTYAVPDLIRSLITTHRTRVAVRDTSGASVSLGPNGSVRGGLGSNAAGGLSPETLLALRAQYPGATISPSSPQPTRVRYVTVKVERRNPEALAALRAIVARSAPDDAIAPPVTYDEAAWAAWWQRNRAGFAGL